MTEPAPAGPAEEAAEAADPFPLLSEAIVAIRLGAAEFGIPIGRVREVLRPPALCRIPFPPPAVCGVASIRGDIIPVMDLGLRLLDTPAERPGRLVVVTGNRDRGAIGLLVDTVVGIVEPAEIDTWEPPPEAEVTLPPGWVTTVIAPEPDRLIAMLDLELVLSHGSAVEPAEGPPAE